MTPRVSVVIPAFNAAPWIGDQLEALANQVGAPKFEVVVADNGSSDTTVEVIKRCGGLARLSIVDASGSPGASHARNVGVKHATGELILFCDADDLVDPRWVGSLVEAHERSGADLIAGALHHERFNSPTVLSGYGIGPDPSVDYSTPSFMADPPPFAGYLPTAAGGNMAVTAETYRAVEGMDPSYPGGSEETAFAWKVQEAGFRVVSCPRAIVHYRLKEDARGIARQQFIQQRARIYLWTQFRHSTMTGPSFKASAISFAKASARAAVSRVRGHEDYRSAWEMGAHAGALAGIMKYRVVPALLRKSRR